MTRNNLYFQSAFHTASTPDANSYEIQGTERLSLAANSVSNNQTIRQHETTVSAEGHLANPVILTRCLPPCVTVAGDVRQEWFRGSSAYLRRGEILQRVRSSGVSVESCGADINGNEAALDTSACCCLTLMSHGFSNAEGQLAQNSSVPCSSGFAKDCWKHLCRGTCCLRCLSVASYRSFHCLLILFASLGVGCIISGLVLGILRMVVYGNFMVLSILFVGNVSASYFSSCLFTVSCYDKFEC